MSEQVIAIASPILTAAAAIVAILYNKRRMGAMSEDAQDRRIRNVVNGTPHPSDICNAKFFDRERGVRLESQVDALAKTTETGFRDVRERLDEIRDMMNGKAKTGG